MRKTIDDIKLESTGENGKKGQIILANTSRPIKDYIVSLQTRLNGKYQKIPNYVIGKDGKIFKILDDHEYSSFMGNEKFDSNSIVISLENLGWLEKTPLSPHYNNWIRSIYKGEIYERKWRDYFFWEPYSDEQIKSAAEVCKFLLKKFSIEKRCIGHNTKIEGIEYYDGITTRSNYDSKYTDVTPAFDFEKFVKFLENE